MRRDRLLELAVTLAVRVLAVVRRWLDLVELDHAQLDAGLIDLREGGRRGERFGFVGRHRPGLLGGLHGEEREGEVLE